MRRRFVSAFTGEDLSQYRVPRIAPPRYPSPAAVGHGLRGLAELSALHMLRARGAHNVARGAVADHATMPDEALAVGRGTRPITPGGCPGPAPTRETAPPLLGLIR